MNEGQDSIARAYVVLPAEHSQIHKGTAFKVTLNIGSMNHSGDNDVDYHFKTPPGKEVHLQGITLGAQAADVTVSVRRGTDENPLVIDAAGDASDASITGPNNLNDVLNYSTDAFIGAGSTYVDDGGAQDGEAWDKVTLPGGSTNQFQSVGIATDHPCEELLLKADTSYIIRVENTDGSDTAQGVFVRLFWYERDKI